MTRTSRLMKSSGRSLLTKQIVLLTFCAVFKAALTVVLDWASYNISFNATVSDWLVQPRAFICHQTTYAAGAKLVMFLGDGTSHMVNNQSISHGSHMVVTWLTINQYHHVKFWAAEDYHSSHTMYAPMMRRP